jgi:transposase-like protein
MSKRRYRMYSDEFKRNALELAETSDKSDAQIERDLGVSSGLLSQWQKRYKVREESNRLELVK